MSKYKEDPTQSKAYNVMRMPKKERDSLFSSFTEEQLEALNYDADFWLRPSQKPPEGNWRTFAMCAGRGFGKTLALAQWVRKKALENPGCRIAIVARTSADARDTLVLGESGILAVHAPDEKPVYKPSTRRLDWPNGSQALILSADSPDQGRGPQFHFSACDEYASWPTKPDASGATMVDQIFIATRLGNSPQIFIATTPKRTHVMQDLIEDAKDGTGKTIVVTGSTLENKNLSVDYIDDLTGRYKNSDLARQEIEGQMLEGAQGLVFTDDMIKNNKIYTPTPPKTPLRIIAVDPTVAAEPRDMCGIMAIGATQERKLHDRTAYILQDYSIKAAPDVWAKEVVRAAQEWGTKYVVVEGNQGGELISRSILQEDPTLKIFTVRATKGKITRAEPVVVALQQGRVKFWHDFQDLEDQMIFYDPANSGYSPDRMDSMVWGVIATIIDPPEGLRVVRTRIQTAAGQKLPAMRGMGKTRQFVPKARRGR